MAPASVHRDDVEFLRRRCGELGEAYAGLSFELPEGPIHGDAHPGATVTPVTVSRSSAHCGHSWHKGVRAVASMER